MTYGDFKRRVLQLIFSYTIAGDDIQLSYNNQADYVKMIPGLLNSAQTYVYQIKKFQDSISMSHLDKEEYDGEDMYILPDDCLSIKPGLIAPGRDRDGYPFGRYNNYRLFGGNKLLLPKGVAEKYNLILEYNKRGVPVSENVPDSYVLKNTDEVNEILPFYVAAFVVMYDDAFRYSALYNEFETRLGRLQPNQTYVEYSSTADLYGGFYNGWCI